MKFQTALEMPDGMTHREREEMLARYEGVLHNGSMQAHDWMASNIFERGAAKTKQQAVAFAEYLQMLAARLRIERGLEHPDGIKVAGKTRG